MRASSTLDQTVNSERTGVRIQVMLNLPGFDVPGHMFFNPRFKRIKAMADSSKNST